MSGFVCIIRQVIFVFAILMISIHVKAANIDLHLLAMNHTWLKLVHYEKGVFQSKFISEVNGSSFFLDPNGKTSPVDELKSTIAAFSASIKNNDESPICRFPARAIWLSKVVPAFKGIDALKNCQTFNNHLIDLNVTSISLLYASGYLGNPASMYGHLLLKLNNVGTTKLLGNTFNYGAVTPANENKLKYISLGIFGGYKARFVKEPFYTHSNTYNEAELRNLWEYEIDLSQPDIKFLLAHHWELREESFDYYFFKQNCAYQIAKLLELVIDKPLIPENKMWVMPFDIINGLVKASDVKSGLLSSITKHNSRQELFYLKYSQLKKNEKTILDAIIRNKTDAFDLQFTSIPESSKKRIIDVSLDYYSFAKVINEGLSALDEEKKKQLLINRFTLPKGKVNWEAEELSPPHNAQLTSLLQISPTYNSSKSNALQLRFRPSYYDLLSLEAGRAPYTALSMFDLTVQITEDDLKLVRLGLVDIKKLNVGYSKLPADNQYSWTFNAVIENVDLSCEGCLVAKLGAGVGKSYAVTKNSMFYSLLDGQLQAPDRSRGYAKAGIKVGLVSKLHKNWRMHLAASYHLSESGKKNHGHSLDWEQRFGSSSSWDIRSKVQINEGTKASLSYGYYW